VKLGAYMIWAAVAVAAGAIVLLGYFTNLDVIIGCGWSGWSCFVGRSCLLPGDWESVW